MATETSIRESVCLKKDEREEIALISECFKEKVSEFPGNKVMQLETSSPVVETVNTPLETSEPITKSGIFVQALSVSMVIADEHTNTPESFKAAKQTEPEEETLKNEEKAVVGERCEDDAPEKAEHEVGSKLFDREAPSMKEALNVLKKNQSDSDGATGSKDAASAEHHATTVTDLMEQDLNETPREFAKDSNDKSVYAQEASEQCEIRSNDVEELRSEVHVKKIEHEEIEERRPDVEMENREQNGLSQAIASEACISTQTKAQAKIIEHEEDGAQNSDNPSIKEVCEENSSVKAEKESSGMKLDEKAMSTSNKDENEEKEQEVDVLEKYQVKDDITSAQEVTFEGGLQEKNHHNEENEHEVVKATESVEEDTDVCVSTQTTVIEEITKHEELHDEKAVEKVVCAENGLGKAEKEISDRIELSQKGTLSMIEKDQGDSDGVTSSQEAPCVDVEETTTVQHATTVIDFKEQDLNEKPKELIREKTEDKSLDAQEASKECEKGAKEDIEENPEESVKNIEKEEETEEIKPGFEIEKEKGQNELLPSITTDVCNSTQIESQVKKAKHVEEDTHPSTKEVCKEKTEKEEEAEEIKEGVKIEEKKEQNEILLSIPANVCISTQTKSQIEKAEQVEEDAQKDDSLKDKLDNPSIKEVCEEKIEKEEEVEEIKAGVEIEEKKEQNELLSSIPINVCILTQIESQVEKAEHVKEDAQNDDGLKEKLDSPSTKKVCEEKIEKQDGGEEIKARVEIPTDVYNSTQIESQVEKAEHVEEDTHPSAKEVCKEKIEKVEEVEETKIGVEIEEENEQNEILSSIPTNVCISTQTESQAEKAEQVEENTQNDDGLKDNPKSPSIKEVCEEKIKKEEEAEEIKEGVELTEKKKQIELLSSIPTDVCTSTQTKTQRGKAKHVKEDTHNDDGLKEKPNSPSTKEVCEKKIEKELEAEEIKTGVEIEEKKEKNEILSSIPTDVCISTQTESQIEKAEQVEEDAQKDDSLKDKLDSPSIKEVCEEKIKKEEEIEEIKPGVEIEEKKEKNELLSSIPIVVCTSTQIESQVEKAEHVKEDAQNDDGLKEKLDSPSTKEVYEEKIEKEEEAEEIKARVEIKEKKEQNEILSSIPTHVCTSKEIESQIEKTKHVKEDTHPSTKEVCKEKIEKEEEAKETKAGVEIEEKEQNKILSSFPTDVCMSTQIESQVEKAKQVEENTHNDDGLKDNPNNPSIKEVCEEKIEKDEEAEEIKEDVEIEEKKEQNELLSTIPTDVCISTQTESQVEKAKQVKEDTRNDDGQNDKLDNLSTKEVSEEKIEREEEAKEIKAGVEIEDKKEQNEILSSIPADVYISTQTESQREKAEQVEEDTQNDDSLKDKLDSPSIKEVCEEKIEKEEEVEEIKSGVEIEKKKEQNELLSSIPIDVCTSTQIESQVKRATHVKEDAQNDNSMKEKFDSPSTKEVCEEKIEKEEEAEEIKARVEIEEKKEQNKILSSIPTDVCISTQIESQVEKIEHVEKDTHPSTNEVCKEKIEKEEEAEETKAGVEIKEEKKQNEILSSIPTDVCISTQTESQVEKAEPVEEDTQNVGGLKDNPNSPSNKEVCEEKIEKGEEAEEIKEGVEIEEKKEQNELLSSNPTDVCISTQTESQIEKAEQVEEDAQKDDSLKDKLESPSIKEVCEEKIEKEEEVEEIKPGVEIEEKKEQNELLSSIPIDVCTSTQIESQVEKAEHVKEDAQNDDGLKEKLDSPSTKEVCEEKIEKEEEAEEIKARVEIEEKKEQNEILSSISTNVCISTETESQIEKAEQVEEDAQKDDSLKDKLDSPSIKEVCEEKIEKEEEVEEIKAGVDKEDKKEPNELLSSILIDVCISTQIESQVEKAEHVKEDAQNDDGLKENLDSPSTKEVCEEKIEEEEEAEEIKPRVEIEEKKEQNKILSSIPTDVCTSTYIESQVEKTEHVEEDTHLSTTEVCKEKIENEEEPEETKAGVEIEEEKEQNEILLSIPTDVCISTQTESQVEKAEQVQEDTQNDDSLKDNPNSPSNKEVCEEKIEKEDEAEEIKEGVEIKEKKEQYELLSSIPTDVCISTQIESQVLKAKHVKEDTQNDNDQKDKVDSPSIKKVCEEKIEKEEEVEEIKAGADIEEKKEQNELLSSISIDICTLTQIESQVEKAELVKEDAQNDDGLKEKLDSPSIKEVCEEKIEKEEEGEEIKAGVEIKETKEQNEILSSIPTNVCISTQTKSQIEKAEQIEEDAQKDDSLKDKLESPSIKEVCEEKIEKEEEVEEIKSGVEIEEKKEQNELLSSIPIDVCISTQIESQVEKAERVKEDAQNDDGLKEKLDSPSTKEVCEEKIEKEEEAEEIKARVEIEEKKEQNEILSSIPTHVCTSKEIESQIEKTEHVEEDTHPSTKEVCKEKIEKEEEAGETKAGVEIEEKKQNEILSSIPTDVCMSTQTESQVEKAEQVEENTHNDDGLKDNPNSSSIKEVCEEKIEKDEEAEEITEGVKIKENKEQNELLSSIPTDVCISTQIESHVEKAKHVKEDTQNDDGQKDKPDNPSTKKVSEEKIEKEEEAEEIKAGADIEEKKEQNELLSSISIDIFTLTQIESQVEKAELVKEDAQNDDGLKEKLDSPSIKEVCEEKIEKEEEGEQIKAGVEIKEKKEQNEILSSILTNVCISTQTKSQIEKAEQVEEDAQKGDSLKDKLESPSIKEVCEEKIEKEEEVEEIKPGVEIEEKKEQNELLSSIPIDVCISTQIESQVEKAERVKEDAQNDDGLKEKLDSPSTKEVCEEKIEKEEEAEEIKARVEIEEKKEQNEILSSIPTHVCTSKEIESQIEKTEHVEEDTHPSTKEVCKEKIEKEEEAGETKAGVEIEEKEQNEILSSIPTDVCMSTQTESQVEKAEQVEENTHNDDGLKDNPNSSSIKEVCEEKIEKDEEAEEITEGVEIEENKEQNELLSSIPTDVCISTQIESHVEKAKHVKEDTQNDDGQKDKPDNPSTKKVSEEKIEKEEEAEEIKAGVEIEEKKEQNELWSSIPSQVCTSTQIVCQVEKVEHVEEDTRNDDGLKEKPDSPSTKEVCEEKFEKEEEAKEIKAGVEIKEKKEQNKILSSIPVDVCILTQTESQVEKTEQVEEDTQNNDGLKDKPDIPSIKEVCEEKIEEEEEAEEIKAGVEIEEKDEQNELLSSIPTNVCISTQIESQVEKAEHVKEDAQNDDSLKEKLDSPLIKEVCEETGTEKYGYEEVNHSALEVVHKDDVEEEKKDQDVNQLNNYKDKDGITSAQDMAFEKDLQEKNHHNEDDEHEAVTAEESRKKDTRDIRSIEETKQQRLVNSIPSDVWITKQTKPEEETIGKNDEKAIACDDGQIKKSGNIMVKEISEENVSKNIESQGLKLSDSSSMALNKNDMKKDEDQETEQEIYVSEEGQSGGDDVTSSQNASNEEIKETTIGQHDTTTPYLETALEQSATYREILVEAEDKVIDVQEENGQYDDGANDEREQKQEESVNETAQACSKIEQEENTKEIKPSVETIEEKDVYTSIQIESQGEATKNEDNAIESNGDQKEMSNNPFVNEVREENDLKKTESKEERQLSDSSNVNIRESVDEVSLELGQPNEQNDEETHPCMSKTTSENSEDEIKKENKDSSHASAKDTNDNSTKEEKCTSKPDPIEEHGGQDEALKEVTNLDKTTEVEPHEDIAPPTPLEISTEDISNSEKEKAESEILPIQDEVKVPELVPKSEESVLKEECVVPETETHTAEEEETVMKDISSDEKTELTTEINQETVREVCEETSSEKTEGEGLKLSDSSNVKINEKEVTTFKDDNQVNMSAEKQGDDNITSTQNEVSEEKEDLKEKNYHDEGNAGDFIKSKEAVDDDAEEIKSSAETKDNTEYVIATHVCSSTQIEKNEETVEIEEKNGEKAIEYDENKTVSREENLEKKQEDVEETNVCEHATIVAYFEEGQSLGAVTKEVQGKEGDKSVVVQEETEQHDDGKNYEREQKPEEHTDEIKPSVETNKEEDVCISTQTESQDEATKNEENAIESDLNKTESEEERHLSDISSVKTRESVDEDTEKTKSSDPTKENVEQQGLFHVVSPDVCSSTQTEKTTECEENDEETIGNKDGQAEKPESPSVQVVREATSSAMVESEGVKRNESFSMSLKENETTTKEEKLEQEDTIETSELKGGSDHVTSSSNASNEEIKETTICQHDTTVAYVGEGQGVSAVPKEIHIEESEDRSIDAKEISLELGQPNEQNVEEGDTCPSKIISENPGYEIKKEDEDLSLESVEDTIDSATKEEKCTLEHEPVEEHIGQDKVSKEKVPVLNETTEVEPQDDITRSTPLETSTEDASNSEMENAKSEVDIPESVPKSVESALKDELFISEMRTHSDEVEGTVTEEISSDEKTEQTAEMKQETSKDVCEETSSVKAEIGEGLELCDSFDMKINKQEITGFKDDNQEKDQEVITDSQNEVSEEKEDLQEKTYHNKDDERDFNESTEGVDEDIEEVKASVETKENTEHVIATKGCSSPQIETDEGTIENEEKNDEKAIENDKNEIVSREENLEKKHEDVSSSAKTETTESEEKNEEDIENDDGKENLENQKREQELEMSKLHGGGDGVISSPYASNENTKETTIDQHVDTMVHSEEGLGVNTITKEANEQCEKEAKDKTEQEPEESVNKSENSCSETIDRSIEEEADAGNKELESNLEAEKQADRTEGGNEKKDEVSLSEKVTKELEKPGEQKTEEVQACPNETITEKIEDKITKDGGSSNVSNDSIEHVNECITRETEIFILEHEPVKEQNDSQDEVSSENFTDSNETTAVEPQEDVKPSSSLETSTEKPSHSDEAKIESEILPKELESVADVMAPSEGSKMKECLISATKETTSYENLETHGSTQQPENLYSTTEENITQVKQTGEINLLNENRDMKDDVTQESKLNSTEVGSEMVKGLIMAEEVPLEIDNEKGMNDFKEQTVEKDNYSPELEENSAQNQKEIVHEISNSYSIPIENPEVTEVNADGQLGLENLQGKEDVSCSSKVTNDGIDQEPKEERIPSLEDAATVVSQVSLSNTESTAYPSETENLAIKALETDCDVQIPEIVADSEGSKVTEECTVLETADYTDKNNVEQDTKFNEIASAPDKEQKNVTEIPTKSPDLIIEEKAVTKENLDIHGELKPTSEPVIKEDQVAIEIKPQLEQSNITCVNIMEEQILESKLEYMSGKKMEDGKEDKEEDVTLAPANESKSTVSHSETTKNIILTGEVAVQTEKEKGSYEIERQVSEEDNRPAELDNTSTPNENELENEIISSKMIPVRNTEVKEVKSESQIEVENIQGAEDLSCLSKASSIIETSKVEMHEDTEQTIPIIGEDGKNEASKDKTIPALEDPKASELQVNLSEIESADTPSNAQDSMKREDTACRTQETIQEKCEPVSQLIDREILEEKNDKLISELQTFSEDQRSINERCIKEKAQGNFGVGITDAKSGDETVEDAIINKVILEDEKAKESKSKEDIIKEDAKLNQLTSYTDEVCQIKSSRPDELEAKDSVEDTEDEKFMADNLIIKDETSTVMKEPNEDIEIVASEFKRLENVVTVKTKIEVHADEEKKELNKRQENESAKTTEDSKIVSEVTEIVPECREASVILTDDLPEASTVMLLAKHEDKSKDKDATLVDMYLSTLSDEKTEGLQVSTLYSELDEGKQHGPGDMLNKEKEAVQAEEHISSIKPVDPSTEVEIREQKELVSCVSQESSEDNMLLSQNDKNTEDPKVLQAVEKDVVDVQKHEDPGYETKDKITDVVSNTECSEIEPQHLDAKEATLEFTNQEIQRKKKKEADESIEAIIPVEHVKTSTGKPEVGSVDLQVPSVMDATADRANNKTGVEVHETVKGLLKDNEHLESVCNQSKPIEEVSGMKQEPLGLDAPGILGTAATEDLIEISKKSVTDDHIKISQAPPEIQKYGVPTSTVGKQLPKETHPKESTESKIFTEKVGSSHEQGEPIAKSLIPEAAISIANKASDTEAQCSSTVFIDQKEKSESVEPAKISLTDVLHEPAKGNSEVAENLIGEKDSALTKDQQGHKNEIGESGVKTNEEDEEEEEDNEDDEKMGSCSDAPVMVEASKDMDVKAHKKSHNILSGVGSKVKHSIAKVKKAITGKSSPSKSPSPKAKNQVIG